MTHNDPHRIILGPIVTEKSIADQSRGVYSFWISPSANKNQVAAAFKTIFSLDPISVNTSSLKGKQKTDWKKRLPIWKSNRKKAIITIAKDKKIELLNLSAKK